MIHDLKTWPVHFQRSMEGSKPFEIRLNDRAYQAGDWVNLHEFDPETKTYTGRVKFGTIGFVTSFKQKDDYVVFSVLDAQEPK